MPADPVDAIKTWLQSAPQEVRDHIMGSVQSAASAHPDHKKAKSEVNYRKADSDEKCGHCMYFDGEGGCQLVAGVINSEYVCDLYSAKDSSNDNASESSDGSDSYSGDSADSSSSGSDTGAE